MWTPERIATLVAALVPFALAVGGGIAWLLTFIFGRLDRKKRAVEPQPQMGLTVDNFADDAIEGWKGLAADRLRQIKAVEKQRDSVTEQRDLALQRLERANRRLIDLHEPTY